MTIICRRSVKHSLQLLDRLAKSTTVSSNDSSDIIQEQIQPLPEQNVEPLNTVLTRWKDEYLQSPKDALHPRQVLEQINRIRNTRVKDSTNIHQQCHHRYSLEKLIRPDLNSYMCVLQAVATSIDNLDRGLDWQQQENRNKINFVDTLFERLLEESKKDVFIKPNAASFATVMNTWVKSNNIDTKSSNVKTTKGNVVFSPSARIEQLLHRMQQLHDAGWHNLQPNVVIYNILLNAWAKEGKIENIEETLQCMIRLEIPGVSPDPVSYSTLLSAYAKSNMPDKADSLLQQMLELYNHGMESAKPNVISFNNVIQCYANVGNGSKAEQWLRRLQDLYDNTCIENNHHHQHYHDPDWKPDLALYNTVLLAWSKSGQPQNAEEFLRCMLVIDEENANDFDENIKPNSRSFNIVLSAWARIGEAERAESILMEMHQLHVEENLDTEPTVVSYNTVLDAYAKKTMKIMNSDEKKNLHKYTTNKTIVNNNTKYCEEDEPWNRAEAILNHMLDLNRPEDLGIRTWNTVINVCAKGGKIDKAEKILDRMISLSTSSGGTEAATPSIRTWNTLLSACMIRGDVRRAKHFWRRMKESGIQPDIVSYNTLLNCYVRSFNTITKQVDNKTKTQDVGSIFNELRHDQNVLANHITYLAMVNFWVNQRKPKRAELFLLKIAEDYIKSNDDIKIHKNEVIPPDLTLFNKVMTGWLRHKEPKQAEKLLLKMAELSDSGFDVRPTTETYNRLLSCWAKSMRLESGERAEVILREMERLVSAGDEEVTPDLYSYNSILDAWSNSGDATALTRIDRLVLEMLLKRESSLLPDSISYGTWLKTIATSGVADKKRRVKDVVKSMNIHNFSPNEYIRQRILSLSKPGKII